jgi:hypothetical protein
MKTTWVERLQFDPVSALLESGDEALMYFARRDILGYEVEPVEMLWDLPEPEKLIRKQQENGSWKYPGKDATPQANTNYDLLETYRNLRILVEMYGFTKAHSVIEKAADYLFICQTDEGDIRGILSNQYMPYYHGAILGLLIEAGYQDDPRVAAGVEWLLSVRQDDGGWVIPAQTILPKDKTPEFWNGNPLPPDRSLPHAHLATGMVLRAFAVHSKYRQLNEALAAGESLKNRFFKADKYNDRKAKSYWLKFQFPFWWTNLITALDSLGKLGFGLDDADIKRGSDWFLQNQNDDGLWPTGYGSGNKSEINRRWVGLAIGRVLSNLFDNKGYR